MNSISEDVKNRISDLGVIYLSKENATVLRKVMDDLQLRFVPLFSARPHVFLWKEHPLARVGGLKLTDLQPYPRLNFVQGSYESAYYSEELFSTVPSSKQIRINDRGAIVNFMVGLNAYTISSGIFPRYLHGNNIIAVPLLEDETMRIGYVIHEKQELSELGRIYVDELLKYAPKA